MTSADLARTETSRLEEFIALNHELAALVRSGLPLELGLGAGGQRHLSGRITERLRSGRSLEDALKEEGDSLPPVYRAVVEAGLRSGRLAEAVETISRAAGAMVRLRRRLAIATVYPAILIVVTFVLAATVLPRLLMIVAAIDGEHGERSGIVQTLLMLLRDNPTDWLFWLPVLIVFLLWLSGGLTALALRLPGLNALLRPYRIAAFADLAAGLLEHGVAFDDALTLAADASGDRVLARDARLVAERLRAGQPAGEALPAFVALPRFARWMLSAGATQGTLISTLRHIADWANRKGAARADWYSFFAPAVLTVFLGGAAVAAFAAISFGPVISLIYKLAAEVSL
ncbi:MAG: type II secretion system F family protein [Planctomycetota bacterium]|nr:type II secretion system F family protein [Planctomycetota bacterium]